MLNQPTCYLSPKLEGRVGPDGSKGVYTLEPVTAGERVAVWGGEIVSEEQLPHIPPQLSPYSVQVEEGLYLVSSHEGPGDWVNHSCNPNAGLAGQIVVVAMRDIAVGEEVCFDYAMSDGSPYDEFDCSCGVTNCRERVTGNDWRNPTLQARYAGYFSPYLQRRIARLQELTAIVKPTSPVNGAVRSMSIST